MSFFRIFKYFKHLLFVIDHHSIHSPFAYEFYQEVILKKPDKANFKPIENLRLDLIHDHRWIEINDLGAGSKVDASANRQVAAIARRGISKSGFSKVLYNLSKFIHAGNILELGTSLGINTLYLAASNPQATVTTIEGCTNTLSVAKEVFGRSHFTNIIAKGQNIEDALEGYVEVHQQVDLVYFDANHRYEPTLRYYQQLLPLIHKHTVIVIDDIYWSKSMAKAWQYLVQRPEVVLSMDFYFAGMLFFNRDIQEDRLILNF